MDFLAHRRVAARVKRTMAPKDARLAATTMPVAKKSTRDTARILFQVPRLFQSLSV